MAIRLRRSGWITVALLAASPWWYGVYANRRVEPEIPTEICLVAAPTPYDPRSGMVPDTPCAIPPNVRCPVCDAFPSRAPDWATQAIFADGNAYFLDSPLSLFIYLRNLPRYAAGRKSADIAAAYVRAVGDGRWIAALQAVCVWGFDVPGPMRGGNLPAFRNHTDVCDFTTRHGGSVTGSAGITAERLRALEPSQPYPAGRHAQRVPVWLWGDADCTVRAILAWCLVAICRQAGPEAGFSALQQEVRPWIMRRPANLPACPVHPPSHAGISEESDLEKTEPASPRRLEQARGEGDVPRSRELALFALTAVSAGGLWVMGDSIARAALAFLACRLEFHRYNYTSEQDQWNYVTGQFIPLTIALGGLMLMLVIAALSLLTLTCGATSFKPLSPDISRLFKLQGLTRMFSLEGLMELPRLLIKLFLVAGADRLLVRYYRGDLIGLPQQDLGAAMHDTLRVAGVVFLCMAAVMMLVTAVDMPLSL